MKKIIFLLAIIFMASFSFLSAQNMPQKNVAGTKVVTQPTIVPATLTAFAANTNPAKGNGKDVVFSENFNTTPSEGIPAGWVQEHVGSGSPWIAVDALYAGTVVTTSPDGTMFMTNLWNGAGPRNAWLISSGFTLTAGETYEVSFYLRLAMFTGEVDKFRVNIGQTQTAAGMLSAHNLYENTTTPIANWTMMTFTYTPTASGTFYLGFHAFSDANMGNDIDIEDVLITGGGGPDPGDCDPATNFAAEYIDNCKAKLTWNEPAKNGKDDQWLTYCVGDFAGGVGLGGPADLTFAQRWSPADLANLGITAGNQVTKMKFFFSEGPYNGQTGQTYIEAAVYEFKIWQGTSSTSAGTLLYTSPAMTWPGTGLIHYEWNEITLTNPITIDPSLELWLGVHANMTAGAGPPCPYGTGGFVTGVNKLLYNGNWSNIEALITGFSSGNWAIQGFVEGMAMPVFNYYNVYRDDAVVASNLNAITYIDEGFNTGEGHTWAVKVACEDGGESDPVSKNLPACDGEGECPAPKNLNAVYADNCTKVNLTWDAPSKGAMNTTTMAQELNVINKAPQAGTLKNVSPAERAIAQNATHNLAASTPIFNAPKGKGTEVLNETFSTSTLPAGWLNLDVDGDGYKWQFTQTAQDCSELYPEGHGDAYSINSGSFYNCVGSLNPNNWLITPSLTLSGYTTLTYWVRVIDAAYSQDHYGVYISTTGTEPSDFTLVFEETLTSAEITWKQRTVGFTQTGENCYIAFRHFNSYDVYIFCIDDVVVTTGDEAPYIPTYNIFRDNVLVQGNHEGTSYTYTEANASIDHTWSVEMNCEAGGVSDQVSKTLENCGCAPATNLTVEISEDCSQAELEWVAPAQGKADKWIQYCSEQVVGRLGWDETSGNDMTVAMRFTAADLTTLGVKSGQTITKMMIGFGTGKDNVEIMELKIWEGGTSLTNPGTLKLTQAVNCSSFTENDWNEVVLNEPFVIDASKEIRIGYRVDNTALGGYPFGGDGGPVVAEKGDLTYCLDLGGWVATSQLLPSWNRNFNIKAYVEGVGYVLFNVYRNDVKIASNITDTHYIDTQFTAGVEQTWAVKVVCDGGGESDPISKSATCVGINENPTTVFSIVPNPANDHINITSGIEFNKIEVINFLGQTILSQSNDSNTARLDVSTLTNGVYFVRIISENGTSVQKFVKQ